MAKKNLIYETTSDFYLGGVYVPKGTTVAHGHELLKGRTHLFKPFVPTFGSVEGFEVPDLPQPALAPPAPAEQKADAAEDQKEVTEDGSGARAQANEDGSYHPEGDAAAKSERKPAAKKSEK